MLVSDFLSVHRSAPVRSKSECYQTLLLLSDAGASVRSNCIIACHDLRRARPDLIYLPPPFAFAAKMGVLWCVAGVREELAGGWKPPPAAGSTLRERVTTSRTTSLPPARIFVSLSGHSRSKRPLQRVSERWRQVQEGEV